MPLYRNRKEPYLIPADIEGWATFTKSPPATWTVSQELCDRFKTIYGEVALMHAVVFNLVPENENRSWVYVTGWKGPVYFTPDKSELPPPPWERPDFTGLSHEQVGELILRAVYHLIELYKKE